MSALRYDNILKENLQEILPGVLNLLLHENYSSVKPLNVELQKTLSRKVDFLFRVKDRANQELLLQVEFQTKNDAAMHYRMYLYSALLVNKFKLPVRQVVFYIGSQAMRMRREWSMPGVQFSYDLFDLKAIDYRRFLSMGKPEIAVFAILGSFDKQEAGKVAQEIVETLKTSGENELDTYLAQLTMLSELRNYEKIVIQILQRMLPNLDPSKSIRYQQGLKQGVQQGMQQGVEQTLRQMVDTMHRAGETIEKISLYTGLSKKHVRQLIQKLPSSD